ncbi:hypothetical protein Pmani_026405 [Petrolisthes manimaculis]|uniref:Putative inositol monophosphatase 3 n=1 Tax=Petrolisthes manimaculis TaxID=1843537 RepID=A0AAE1P3P1_9EUCA|nr:hypothetical protein Pmani_026405 [Petrolisthes manimaculis]
MLYQFGGDNEVKTDLPPQMISLKSLLSAAIDAAERGGKNVYDVRVKAELNEKSKGKTLENANDPVTNGDIMSHRTMFQSLQRAFPSVKIISEEKDTITSDTVDSADITRQDIGEMLADNAFVPAPDIRVWIDPLDATQEYTENLRQYVTTMVCVAVKGYATIGVIHKPFEHYTAWGWAGKTTSPDLQAAVAKGSSSSTGDLTRVIVSRSHHGEVSDLAMSAFGEKTNITYAGGAGYKTLEVIKGQADLYLHITRIKKWDLCAGNAILNALDGKMTTLDGKVIDYGSEAEYINNGGLVATLHNHAKYIKQVQEAKKTKTE